jgi:hypothetical protein
MENNSNKQKELSFNSAHLPNWTTGNYQVTVEQDLTHENDPVVAGKYSVGPWEFSVLGERFQIAPGEIDSVFPPSGGLGDYSTVLPHIVLNRSTLPWERTPTENGEQDDSRPLPWLALLVFQEEELQPQSTDSSIRQKAVNGFNFKLADLEDLDTFNAAVADENKYGDLKGNLSGWPEFKIKDEYGQDPNDLVSMIFVERTLLQSEKNPENSEEETNKLMPVDLDELSYLAHTRENNEEPKEEKAVIFSKRLPAPSKNTVAHLVSVENRFDEPSGKFNFGTGKYIPLISLKSWRFTSLSAKHNLRGKMLHLNHQAIFQLKDEGISAKLRRKQRPQELKDAFAGIKRPLTDDSKVVDEGFRILKTNRDTYLLGETALYNQAGLKLHSLSDPIDPKNPPSESALLDILIQLTKETGIQFLPKNKNYIRQENNKYSWTIAKNEKRVTKIIDQGANNYWWINDGAKRYFVDLENGQITVHQLFTDQNPTLRLPDTDGTSPADKFLRQGFVPLPHRFRQGSQSVSWYRGPLAVGPNYQIGVKEGANVKMADELLIYQQDTGFFDVSYAAAWELGRLLALRSKSFSGKLDQWKRAHKRLTQQAIQQQTHKHLAGGTVKKGDPTQLTPEMDAWLDQLLNLKIIPYNYLVPNQQVLPSESIRFFYLNQEWMSSLLHGAFSLGRPLKLPAASHPVTRKMKNQGSKTGFILNSSIISGWPGLQIEAINEKGEKLGTIGKDGTILPPLRYQLAPNILLFLVDGDLWEVDFFPKPEALHFGFKYIEEDEHYHYSKNFRKDNGTEDLTYSKNFTPPTKRVVDVKDLFESLNLQRGGDLTVAQFALSMIEGVDKFKWKRRVD